jgi:dihydroorotase-like cyclic amidohydrolase
MFDLLLKNGKVVFPGRDVVRADIGVNDGKITQIGSHLDEQKADTTIDADGKFVFPGIIDSHFHVGIYRPLIEDAFSESSSAVSGGVTTILSYFRSGRNYLNSSDPYSILFKKVLELSKNSFFTDYGYHLAPIMKVHVQEIPELISNFGVSTFKYYMFYRGLVLRGEFRKGAVEKEYLLSPDPYDLGHLLQIMTTISETNRRTGGGTRLSIHAEDAELIRIFKEGLINDDGGFVNLNPLETYSRSRPPESERLALIQAAELASNSGCPINILHVSSEVALITIGELRRRYPNLDMMTEVTVHHLMLNDHGPNPSVLGKVNPPIRSRKDSEALWSGILNKEIHTVASDHACLTREQKGTDIWSAEPGFGGTELLLPSLFTEGYLRRKIPIEQLACLVTSNPARYHGLADRKGDIAIGMDADFAICDANERRVVDHKNLHSYQDFSPFDGLELSGWVSTTILRGRVVFDGGKVLGSPEGEYLMRSSSSPVRQFPTHN